MKATIMSFDPWHRSWRSPAARGGCKGASVRATRCTHPSGASHGGLVFWRGIRWARCTREEGASNTPCCNRPLVPTTGVNFPAPGIRKDGLHRVHAVIKNVEVHRWEMWMCTGGKSLVQHLWLVGTGGPNHSRNQLRKTLRGGRNAGLQARDCKFGQSEKVGGCALVAHITYVVDAKVEGTRN